MLAGAGQGAQIRFVRCTVTGGTSCNCSTAYPKPANAQKRAGASCRQPIDAEGQPRRLSGAEPAARVSGWCWCRSFCGLQFLFVLCQSAYHVGMPFLPLRCLQGPMICVTKAALDSQQKLVIANRLVASPTAAIRYRELGHGSGLDLCAHLLTPIADHLRPAKIRYPPAVTTPRHAIGWRQRPAQQEGPHIVALIDDAPVGLRGGQVDRNALHVERREHLVFAKQHGRRSRMGRGRQGTSVTICWEAERGPRGGVGYSGPEPGVGHISAR